MISSEVQRTLVKSPPELWAELSDPAALARHLGGLGEIRIVHIEPESTVEWAAENTTGTVSIKPSGWGTKVTISVKRETAAAAPEGTAEPEVTQAREPDALAEGAPEPAADAEQQPPTPDALPEPASTEAAPELTSSDAGSDVEPEPMAPELAPEPACETETESQPAPRRGFFARLFGRRRAAPEQTPTVTTEATPAPEASDEPVQIVESAREPGQSDAFAAVTEALEPEAFAEAHPFAVVPSVAKPASASLDQQRFDAEPAAVATPADALDDISAELVAAESIAAEDVSAEEVTAVLTAVLDRLGAAHHRPFSRS
jgi:hypothetical protein